MKNKLIEHIETLIKEHEESGYYIDYEQALQTENIEQAFYDVGRYEALKEVLRMVQKL